MARLFDAASEEYLQREQAAVTGLPIAMVCKFRVNADDSNYTLMWAGDKDVIHHFVAMWLSSAANKLFVFSHYYDEPGGGTHQAISGSSYNVDTWHHACGIWVGDSERRAYIDGGKGTNTGTVGAMHDHDSTAIGRLGDSSPAYYMSGDIAEAAVYDLSAYPGVTDSDKADYFETNILPHLVAGEPPSDYQTGLVAYWPLRDDDLDYEDGFDLTPYNTPSWSTQPTVLHLLGSSVSVQSAVSGKLQWLQELAGSIDAHSGVAIGNLQLLQELAGSIDAHSDITGNIEKIIIFLSLAGSIAAQSTVAGKLQEISLLSGSIAAQAALTAKLRDLSFLSGSIDAQSSVTGDLIEVVTYLLSGTIAAHSGVTGNLIQLFDRIPPFMVKDLIDPYSGGAWLWLAKIVIPTRVTQRIAKNNEDIRYSGEDFLKNNFELSTQKLSGDASIPRIILRVAQDNDRTLENIVNATQGGADGTVTIIRTCEKFLDEPVLALQTNYDILTIGSDTSWVTLILGMPNLLLQRYPLWSYSSKTCELATPSLFGGARCQYDKEAPDADTTCTGLFEDCYTKGNAVHWGAELGLDPNAVRI